MRASKYYRKARYRNADGGIGVRLISYSGVGLAVVYVNSPLSAIPFSVGQSVTYSNGNTSLTGNISDITFHDMGSYTTINISYNGPAISGMDGGNLAPAVESTPVPDSFMAIAHPVTWDSSNTIPAGYVATVDSNGTTRLIEQTNDPATIAYVASQHPDLPVAAMLAPDAPIVNGVYTPAPAVTPITVMQNVPVAISPSPAVQSQDIVTTQALETDDSGNSQILSTAPIGSAVQSSDSEDSSGMIIPSTQPQVQGLSVPKMINASSIILFLVLGGVALWGINKL